MRQFLVLRSSSARSDKFIHCSFVVRLMVPLWLSMLASSTGFAAAPEVDSWTVQSLVEAHKQSRELVHTIELRIDHYIQNFEGERAVSQNKRAFTYTWAKDGRLERIRYRDHLDARSTKDRPTNLSDVLNDGTVTKQLLNWDENRPQKIAPLDQGSVRGVIMPQTRKPVGGPPSFCLLWEYAAPVANDDGRTLEMLLAESPEARLLGRREVGEHSLWCLRFTHPGVDGSPLPGAYIDVYIDPAVNFAVRRAVEHQAGIDQYVDGKIEKVAITTTRDVMRFRDFGDGVYIPEETHNRTVATTSDRRSQLHRYIVTDISVNQPLSEGALDFRFPEHLLVRHSPPVDGRTRVQLWRANNQPVKEINEMTDIPEYRKIVEQVNATSGRASSSVALQVFIAINLAIAVIVLFWVLMRRRGRRPA